MPSEGFYRGMSKGGIPKEGNVKRDTKTNRWNPWGSLGEHGGAKGRVVLQKGE